jgi:hypothetical protein
MAMSLINNKMVKALVGGIELESAMPHWHDPQAWVGHTKKDGYIVFFCYRFGTLSISMTEIEYNLYKNLQPVARQEGMSDYRAEMMEEIRGFNNLIYKPITFKEVLELLEWTCEDYIESY